jgi:UDP-N-acetylmuramoylalanine--D-glutamate ligase
VFENEGIIYYDREPIIPVCEIRLKGDFNIKNVKCAISVCAPIISIDAIREQCRSFSGVSARMSEVARKDGVTYIDSSIDTTPSRTASTVSAFEKSKTILILGGYDKNLDYECLAHALDGIKLAIICGQNKDKIYSAIKNTCQTKTVDSFESAVKIARSVAQSGDFIILSPASASFDKFKNYKEKSEKFKQIVKETEQNDEGPFEYVEGVVRP